ncbi:MAG: 2-phosphosulfolactate phosphatase [Ignavibacteriales bacterium]|jgi:2-phosphosulfolactate phosphatase|nr:2-phosphosulfolactate phosphatase [Ignavibacteriaceae bacterium]NLH61049.1 2-phosphosulfolactate phosphatase [Ignavibacteriales bacterium]HOJ18600.1 2-phosphosulfolactate phosphatase [Ignavibacteriaceae bacterium]HPO56781.1 2-phosphosulfolactate phosphatase [Ignavibacteriaceae bacterium]
MNINLFLSPESLDDFYFQDKNCVVIDSLRATSVICTALANGAKEVIPVATFEYAMKISAGIMSGQNLLGGERNTKKIDGFHVGNSPSEYTPETVSGKSIILFTSNGTKAIVKAKFSKDLVICSYLNLKAIANYLLEKKEDFEIVCSAKGGALNMEDTVCAGRLISKILEKEKDCTLNDGATAACALDREFGGNVHKMFRESDHGKILTENGFQDDLEICAQIDALEVVPVFTSGSIKLLNN